MWESAWPRKSTYPSNLTRSLTLTLVIHHRRNASTTHDLGECENVGGGRRCSRNPWWITHLSPSTNSGAWAISPMMPSDFQCTVDSP